MKRVWVLAIFSLFFFVQTLDAQIFSPGLRPLPQPQPPVSEEKPAISFDIEAGDVLATEDNATYYVGKIEEVSGKDKNKELHILFADGHEAWLKPDRIIEKCHMITKGELKLDQEVLFTTQIPETFQNGSIRFTAFSKGTIKNIDEIESKLVTVNADEVRWDQQVLTW
ncbi:MAG: hypothetical protein PHN75_01605 [Syntrophales bacterium]|nr:hypothetical protein [Syntrophales bacterium]